MFCGCRSHSRIHWGSYSALSLCERQKQRGDRRLPAVLEKALFIPSLYNIECGSGDLQQRWPLFPCLQASLWRNSSGELFPFQNSCKIVESQASTLLRGFRVLPFMIVFLCQAILCIRAAISYSEPSVLQCLNKDKTKSIKMIHGIKMSSSDDWCCGWLEQFPRRFVAFVLSSA